jgi:hypothetical protein
MTPTSGGSRHSASRSRSAISARVTRACAHSSRSTSSSAVRRSVCAHSSAAWSAVAFLAWKPPARSLPHAGRGVSSPRRSLVACTAAASFVCRSATCSCAASSSAFGTLQPRQGGGGHGCSRQGGGRREGEGARRNAKRREEKGHKGQGSTCSHGVVDEARLGPRCTVCLQAGLFCSGLDLWFVQNGWASMAGGKDGMS